MIGQVIEDKCAEFLEALDLGPVQRHPNGRSKPPDFFVGETIAVEATYLNEYHQTGSKPFDVSAITPARLELLKEAVEKATPLSRDGSAYVHFDIAPELDLRDHASDVALCLNAISVLPGLNDRKFALFEGLSLSFLWTPTVHPTAFRLGSFQYRGSEGFFVLKVLNSLSVILPKKKEKLEKVSLGTRERWICLGAGDLGMLDDDELSIIASSCDWLGYWHRMIFLNLLAPDQSRIIDPEGCVTRSAR
ncbi:MAG TPA: hypothetical protein PKD10_08760 [Paracoccaceae bacterium]|nr:hypothetical protein [Paracoccaceae bacterium]HMO71918.1 hypothetical protein [Paracoccaceae bacterium]